MMKTIILEKVKVYCGTVLLVNAGHPIKEKEAAGLMPADMHFPDILMRRDAANALQFIKSYQDDCRFVYEPDYGTGIEIYYAPANGSQTLVVMPETCLYQISGNNTDGFIITVWKNFRK